MSSNATTTPAYIPALDGLRALAVLSVMAFHIGIFPIGWIGVPLFFVLSGYLITRILSRQVHLPLKDYLSGFYWRRTVRIFPLYYLYLVVNAILILAMGWSFSGYHWFVLFLGNYQIANTVPHTPGGMIQHLWSLAVEEQFYLIWPLIVFFFYKNLKLISFSLIVLSLISRYLIFQYTGNPYLTILTLISCTDMLAAGALASLCSQRVILILGVIGIAIVTFGFMMVDYNNFAETNRWVPKAIFLYTGLGLTFSLIVKNASRFRFLENFVLRYVGQISYGLYMWHLLTFAIADRLPVSPAFRHITGVFLAFGTAMISWHLFESKVLKFKDRVIPSIKEPTR